MSFREWDKLLYGIGRGECILFLGPELPWPAAEGEHRSTASALARQLLLEDLDAEAAPAEVPGLAQIAQRVLLREEEMGLEMRVGSWYEALRGKPSSLHDDLAALPFRLIVSSAHDPLMEEALRRQGKRVAVERYHYRGRNKELLPLATSDEPVLFHLFGHVAEPPSVVLAETQLLDFLAKLIAADPPLPNDLKATLADGRLFLFLGFGLRQWYLRILLHVLKVLRRNTLGFAVEEIDAVPGDRDAVVFYRENFKINVYDTDAMEFVRELRRRWVPSPGTAAAPADQGVTGTASAAPTAASPASIFICHASEDAATAREVHDLLKRAGFEPWLDRESLRGGDRWGDLIESEIGKMDYFVVLNSRSLEAKSRGVHFVNKEIKTALKAEDLRLTGSFIIPVRVDDAELLQQLAAYHVVEWSSGEGGRELVRAIRRQAGRA